MTAEQTVARLGAYCRLEQAIFSTLGSWVLTVSDPSARIALAELSDHAGWRAQRWFEALPTAPPGRDVFLVSTEADIKIFASVNKADDGSDAARLGIVAGEILPRMYGLMVDHLAATEDVAQRPIRRLAEIHRADLDRDLAMALGVFERSVVGADQRSAADRARGHVATVIDRVGGLIGF